MNAARLLAAAVGTFQLACGAVGQCHFKIIGLMTCDDKGNARIPSLGDPDYGIRVDWQVEGVAKAPYDVEFSMADQSWTWKNANALGPGHYHGIARFSLPLDGEIPFHVTLDPDHRSGNVDLPHASASGSFVPHPPTKLIEYFAPKAWRASQTMSVHVPRSSNIATISYMMARPTTETFERILKDKGIPNTTQIKTQPFGYRVYRRQVAKPPEGTVALTHTFDVECFNVRADLARGMASWAAYAHVPKEIRAYAQPESIVESDAPAVRAFVKETLPKDFRPRMKPYDAAKALFMAVANRLTYETPADASATAGLRLHKGDCGTFASLYVASLRSIGIPARNVCGWRSGKDRWHCWCEVYVPHAGWMPQDPTDCQTCWIQHHSKGGFAYFFATMPDLNSRVVVSRCSTYTTEEGTWQTMQPGQWGILPDGAKEPKWSSTCSLTPIGKEAF